VLPSISWAPSARTDVLSPAGVLARASAVSFAVDWRRNEIACLCAHRYILIPHDHFVWQIQLSERLQRSVQYSCPVLETMATLQCEDSLCKPLTMMLQWAKLGNCDKTILASSTAVLASLCYSSVISLKPQRRNTEHTSHPS